MTLTAIRPSCWSGKLALSLNGRAIGAAEPKTWSGGYDLKLTGGRRLAFGKGPGAKWYSQSPLALLDGDGRPVATAETRGRLKSTWRVNLSVGPAELKSKSFWNSGRLIVPVGTDEGDAAPVADLDWLNRKQSGAAGGWRVTAEGGAGLTPTDLLLIGFTYQAIRNAQAAAAAGAGAA